MLKVVLAKKVSGVLCTTINSLYEVIEANDLVLDAGLCESVVVLYPLHEVLQTPETVCLYPLEGLGRELGEVVRLWVLVPS